MGKVEVFQCDNKRCPDESETRDIEKEQWWTVSYRSGDMYFYFCTDRCLKMWVEDRDV